MWHSRKETDSSTWLDIELKAGVRITAIPYSVVLFDRSFPDIRINNEKALVKVGKCKLIQWHLSPGTRSKLMADDVCNEI